MGALDYSLEDLDIEVTKNDGDTDMDVAAADSEATITVENALRLGHRIETVLNNLFEMIGHVKKFGISKPLLALHNKKNQLGRAARMTLPTYESDDQFDDVDPTDYNPDEVVAGLEGAFSDAKNKVVEWFKKMIETIKNFFKERWGSAARLEKRLVALKAKLKANPNWDKIGAMEVETYKFSDLTETLNALSAAFNALKTIEVSETAAFNDAKIKLINDGLAKVGYVIAEDEKDTDKYGKDDNAVVTYKIEENTDSKLEKSKEKLSSLGWSVGGLEKYIDTLRTIVKTAAKGDALISTLNKASSKATKAANSTADTAANEYEKDKAEKKAGGYNRRSSTSEYRNEGVDNESETPAETKPPKPKDEDLEKNKNTTGAASANLINRATVIIKSVTKITDAIFNLASVFCALGEKIPMKKG